MSNDEGMTENRISGNNVPRYLDCFGVLSSFDIRASSLLTGIQLGE